MQASKVISGFRSAAIGCWGINSSHISPLIDPSDQCIGSNFLGNAIQDNLGFRHLRQSCWWYLICVVGLLVKINCIYSKIIHWRTFSHFPMLTEVHKKRWPSNTHLETHQHYNSEKPTCIHFYNTVEIYFGGHLTLWVGKLPVRWVMLGLWTVSYKPEMVLLSARLSFCNFRVPSLDLFITVCIINTVQYM